MSEMVEGTGAKVALVTGAGRGIGRSVAIGLAQDGIEVVLVARNAEQLDEVADVIRESGGSARAVATDVSDPSGVERLALAIADLPAPGILVNAAGTFGPMSPIVDSDPTAWSHTIAVNLMAAYLTCRRFAPAMIDAGWGRILNVSSAASLHRPGPLNSAYATSKAALNQFTRHLASELEGTGVTANVFHPGDVKTEMFHDISAQTAGSDDPGSRSYATWVEWVDRTGGDSPQKAVDLVLDVISDATGTPNGQFLWIRDPLQLPIPSWDTGTGSAPAYLDT